MVAVRLGSYGLAGHVILLSCNKCVSVSSQGHDWYALSEGFIGSVVFHHETNEGLPPVIMCEPLSHQQLMLTLRT